MTFTRKRLHKRLPKQKSFSIQKGVTPRPSPLRPFPALEKCMESPIRKEIIATCDSVSRSSSRTRQFQRKENNRKHHSMGFLRKRSKIHPLRREPIKSSLFLQKQTVFFLALPEIKGTVACSFFLRTKGGGVLTPLAAVSGVGEVYGKPFGAAEAGLAHLLLPLPSGRSTTETDTAIFLTSPSGTRCGEPG